MQATRHFVTLGNRQVHYRRAGKGPVVLALHGSPESGRSQLMLMSVLADRFTVIAPDTPGNGLSDPLPLPAPTIDDYADGVAAFMDALGIAQAGFYGFHTGAAIANSLAQRKPERVAVAVLDGYPVFSKEERDDILANYLPPFEPRYDGSHMLWLWSRFTDQSMFFPWYARHTANRMSGPVPAPEVMSQSILEVLRSGDHYRNPYRAAFNYDAVKGLTDHTRPIVITAMPSDPLSTHTNRYPPLSRTITVSMMQDRDRMKALGKMREWFLAHPAKTESPAIPATEPRADGQVHNAFLDLPGGQIRVRLSGKRGAPVLLTGDTGAGGRPEGAAQSWADKGHAVLLPDFAGYGESDDFLGARRGDAGAQAEVLAAALHTLGMNDADVIAARSSSPAALELAKQGKVKRLALIGAPLFSEAETVEIAANGVPSIAPRWDGTHFSAAWHMVRYQAMFFPWTQMRIENAVPGEPRTQIGEIHKRTVEVLKAGDRYRDAVLGALRYPLAEALQAARVPLSIVAAPWEWYMVPAKRAAAVIGKPLVMLPDEPKDWPNALFG
jgi:pimeloyl-ACP methyl ester carboxylesterase